MKQQGVSLLELLLVIAVIAAIVLGSFHFYRYRHMQLIAAKLDESLTQLFLLGNQYYYAQCQNPSIDLSSQCLQDLTNWAISSSSFTPQQIALINNPSGSDWQFNYINTSSTERPFWVFKVSVAFPNLSQEQQQFLQAQLHADHLIQNNTLTWTRTPSQISSKAISNNSLWVANNDLRNFAILNNHSGQTRSCPG